MSNPEGLCVEYIAALKAVQERVRELRIALREDSLTPHELNQRLGEMMSASHTAWHLERALVTAFRSSVQMARRRERDT